MAKSHVVIVGSGEFGASTALSLLRSGKYTVTVLDRAAVLPAEDAASTDINKVVRFDYAEKDYADLCWEAIERWKSEFPGVYHESGVVLSAIPALLEGPDAPMQPVLPNVEAHVPVTHLSTSADFIAKLDPSRKGLNGPQHGRVGYYNPVGGWANAALGVKRLHERILALGGEIVPSAEVVQLLHDGGKGGSAADGNGDVSGVKCADGREFRGDKVVLAMGSWTGSFMKDLLPQQMLVATGLGLGAFQLSKDEVERYKDVPVIMAWDGSGFYCFPPNEDGLMKFALHGAGYATESGVPRTSLTEGAKGWHAKSGKSWIPRPMAKLLRQEISLFYPELAKRPFDFTRMCYYSDSPDGNWVIDYHPRYHSLLIASGGSGHAYKFLPVIGEKIHARLEDRLEEGWRRKWAIEGREEGGADRGRGAGGRTLLRLEDLAGFDEVPGVAGDVHGEGGRGSGSGRGRGAKL